jgi:hypothetical protein
MAAEEGAKRMARDIELYKKRDDTREIEEASSNSGKSTQDTTQRGTKDLMRMIHDGINSDDEDIEDAKIEE